MSTHGAQHSTPTTSFNRHRLFLGYRPACAPIVVADMPHSDLGDPKHLGEPSVPQVLRMADRMLLVQRTHQLHFMIREACPVVRFTEWEAPNAVFHNMRLLTSHRRASDATATTSCKDAVL